MRFTQHEVTPLGSTFQACAAGGRRATGQRHLVCPHSDQTLGPDGAPLHDLIYTIGGRLCIPTPMPTGDRTNGRVPRRHKRAESETRASMPRPRPDRGRPTASSSRCSATRTSGIGVAARRIPAGATCWRRGRRAERARGDSCQSRCTGILEALWALYGCVVWLDRGADGRNIARTSRRRMSGAWCVRFALAGDEPDTSSGLAQRAWPRWRPARPDVRVRSQLACTARRIVPQRARARSGPTEPAVSAATLMAMTHIFRSSCGGSWNNTPLLIWKMTLARFTSPRRPGRQPGPGQRSDLGAWLKVQTSAEKNATGDSACARMIASAPSVDARRPLLVALDAALRERQADTLAPSLARAVSSTGRS